jgi:hypothetical protein
VEKAPITKHLPSPKRLPAAQGFARLGYAQAGQSSNNNQYSNTNAPRLIDHLIIGISIS